MKKRGRKRKRDMLQMKLTVDKIGKTVTAEPDKVEVEYLVKEFSCPFCLYTGQANKFFLKIKGGYSEKRFKCLDCGQIMRRETLTREMTIEQFAEWVFSCLISGDHKRFSWDKFNKRLREKGVSWQFWSIYKKIKREMVSDEETHYEEEYEKWRKAQKEEQ